MSKWYISRRAIYLTFTQSPSLPEVDHEILQILESQLRLVQLLAIESLAKAPASINAA